jgi:hypothetical protein
MRYLNRTVRRLEQQRKAGSSPCTTCGGSGDRGKLIVQYEDAPQQDCSPCSVCGREPLVINVVTTAKRPDHLDE